MCSTFYLSTPSILIGWFFIRLSDEESEGIWRDPDGKENLTFTNWEERPNGRYRDVSDHAIMDYDGKWRDSTETYEASEFILCEFT